MMKKGILTVPLLALFYVDLVLSLECYYCPSAVPSAECTEVVNCTKNEPMCKTKVTDSDFGFPFQGTEHVTRGCAKQCFPSSLDTIGDANPIFCCNSDRCNNRGLSAGKATGIRAGRVALPMCMASIFFLHRTAR
uniref:Ly6/PLAUR domain-containing protein 2-like n=1 Tax=Geotrypetes seraphini TaxID=260995 RepID=A0A6P8PJ75_GEOSA|nr:ly6/PLAUR domain-containing protein 2-like [Geotrypetes seraphini]